MFYQYKLYTMTEKKESPGISCICSTYGRINTLEELVYSFINQDYDGKKELIIINDYSKQKIVFDHPDVKIWNLDETFNTIGDKSNFATEQCNYDIIAVFDDDDIALPNHLKNVAKYFTDETNILHWENGIFYNEPNITDITWIGNSGIVFRKSAWEAIGKHPIENAGYDMTFIERLYKYGGRTFAKPPKEEASWYYRWHMPSANIYHQSGLGTDIPGRPNIIERHSEHIEKLRQEGKILTGSIKLLPHWNQDYQELLNNFITK